MNGSREINHGNRENKNRDGKRSFQIHADCSFPRENSFESLFCLSRSCDRNALPPDPSRRSLQHLEETQQGSSVVVLIGSARQRSLIAGLLRQFCQMPAHPPGQWVEPENCAIQQRDALRQRVATHYMRKFVSQNGIEFLRVPFAPVRRKQDRRPKSPHSYRYVNALRCPHPRSRPPGRTSELPDRETLRDRSRTAYQLAGQDDSCHEPRQEEDRYHHINPRCNDAPWKRNPCE